MVRQILRLPKAAVSEADLAAVWLALDDATLDNGCLWLRNASHREPLRRVFVRDREPHEPDPEMVFVSSLR